MMNLFFVKLGGSLLTDKRRPETAHEQVIAALADEISSLREEFSGQIVVGHGSGSFGHVAAERHRIGSGPVSRQQWPGVSETQARAARLHRIVVEALEGSGARPFSLAPSSFLIADSGRPADLWHEPLTLALDAGLLPVVFGDVVMDRSWGASIVSTESVFEALIASLGRSGARFRGVAWLGITQGVYDGSGATIGRISAGNVEGVLEEVSGAAGTDVTGGMRHRIEAAWRLAELGVRSWIVDGRVPGNLERAARGESVAGTVVELGGSEGC